MSTDRVSRLMEQVDRDVSVAAGRAAIQARAGSEAQGSSVSPWRSVVAAQLLLTDFIKQQETITNLYDSHIQATKKYIAETEQLIAAVQATMRNS